MSGRVFRTLSIATSGGMFIALASSVGVAITIYVPSQYPTIQMGIDRAQAGDEVLVAPGSYSDYETRTLPPGSQWTSCVFLKDGVVVKSEGGPEVTSIDLSLIQGPQPTAINARFLPSDTSRIEGFSLQGPYPLAVYAFFCGDVTVKDCIFRGFDGGPTTGGAVIVNGNASFIDCEFTNCVARHAGAIWHTAGHLDLIGCSFRECNMAAVLIDQIGQTTSVLAESCQFIDNWNDTAGAGALQISRAWGGVIVRNSFFVGNVSYSIGAGALGLGSGQMTAENCVFIENRSTGGSGGGLKATEGTIRGCTFMNNHKEESPWAGSAIWATYSVIENNAFYGGTGGGHVDASYSAWGCNVFWANSDGPGIALSPTDREIDPEFCGVEAFDLTLNEGSPCLPSDPLGCGLIGAYGQGCGTISVESSSWAKIKNLYR